MTSHEFLKLAAEHRLDHIANELLSTAVPGLRALKEAMHDAGPGDKTFIGGVPSPPPRQWPAYKETPLTFVAQVDTDSLPSDICPASLPSGILQFFVPSAREVRDNEPSLDGGRVLFVPAGGPSPAPDGDSSIGDEPKAVTGHSGRNASLMSCVARFFGVAPRNPPASGDQDAHKPLPKRSFDWEVFPTLYRSAPDAEALWLPDTALEFEFDHEADQYSYFDLRRAVMEWNWRVQMFGFANPQQEEMEPLVDLASGRRSPNEFEEWILLFALNSACGGLAPETLCYYFWIHCDDLANGNFEEVWLCAQQD